MNVGSHPTKIGVLVTMSTRMVLVSQGYDELCVMKIFEIAGLTRWRGCNQLAGSCKFWKCDSLLELGNSKSTVPCVHGSTRLASTVKDEPTLSLCQLKTVKLKENLVSPSAETWLAPWVKSLVMAKCSLPELWRH